MALTSLAPSQGLQNFVDEASNLLVASNTMSSGQLGGSGIFRSQVLGRAPITDISQDLNTGFGISRISAQVLVEAQGESGPSQQRVWTVANDKRGLIRCVGTWSYAQDSDGAYIRTATTDDFIEITFYGTGLNVMITDASSGGIFVTSDGGSEGANIYVTQAAALNDRTYSSNIILAAATGLALGIHTIKLRSTGTPSYTGFEILNESTQLKTAAGSAFVQGKKQYVSSVTAQAYNSGFTNTFGSVGVKGGRVLVYLASDNTIKKDIRYTESSQLNLTNADHTNEEAIRTYHWREFGSGRGDDFSSPLGGGANRAGTLDDNTTTLMALGGRDDSGFTDSPLYVTATNNYYSIQFMGTGLDMIQIDSGATIDPHAVTINGTNVGNLTAVGTSQKPQRTKLVSGLPYGMHVVQIKRTNNVSNAAGVRQFITYAPKKPALPSGAIELADYCLMATYVANATANVLNIATGILRKTPARETTYVQGTTGTSNWSVGVSVGQPAALQASTDRLNAYFEQHMFGTGFEYRTQVSAGRGTNTQWTANGLTLNTTNFPALASTNYGGATFNTSTGVSNFSGGSSDGGISITGLPLGSYTIRANNGTASVFLQFDCFDIITPVYTPRSNSGVNAIISGEIGSCSLSDNRQTSPFNASAQILNTFQSYGVTSNPSTTSTVFVPMPDMSGLVKTSTGKLEINFIANLANLTNGNLDYWSLFIDGTQYGPEMWQQNPAGGNTWQHASLSMIAFVAPGVHKVDIFWKASGSTTSSAGIRRYLSVKEIP